MARREFLDDPEMGDENDPEYKEELFNTFKAMGWTPQDLAQEEDQKEYAEWLESKK